VRKKLLEMHAAATQRQPIALANANEDSATNGTFARQNTTQKTLNRPREREIPSQVRLPLLEITHTDADSTNCARERNVHEIVGI